MPNREQAWCLLTEFTQSESLRKHALAVEACMQAYSEKFSADSELWSIVGLLAPGPGNGCCERGLAAQSFHRAEDIAASVVKSTSGLQAGS